MKLGAKKKIEIYRHSLCLFLGPRRIRRGRARKKAEGAAGKRVRAGGQPKGTSRKASEKTKSGFFRRRKRKKKTTTTNKGKAKLAPFSLFRSFSARAFSRRRSSRSTRRRGKRFQSPRTTRDRLAEASPKESFFSFSLMRRHSLRRSLSSLSRRVCPSHFTSTAKNTNVSTCDRHEARIDGA